MKKTLSVLLAVLFVLTAFGATTVFGGVIGAGAAFYDYYEYVKIPGFSAFSETEMGLAFTNGCSFKDFDTTTLPDAVTANFTVTKPDGWGGASMAPMRLRNADPENNKQGQLMDSPIWGANDKINGKDIFGDTGVTMEDANGFCFWVGVNGEPYQGSIKLQIFTIPSKGPFYKHSEDGSNDMEDYDTGFVYECDASPVDEDGYVYFDFKTDFFQCDWWSVDDEGVNHFRSNDPNRYPVPQSKIPLVNGMNIRFSQIQAGDIISVSDFRVFYDTRIHLDELEEQISVFDSLDPEAYTDESYLAAVEVYLEAYEMIQEYESYTQKQIDAMAKELKVAIADLKPMFKITDKSIRLSGFEVWDEADFDDITSGGLCLDTPAVEEDIAPFNKDQSVLVMANAQDGPPTYGWSLFTNAVDNAGEIAAIKNPFELVGDSAPLSESSGLRFWLKWDESIDPIPYAMRIGVGSAADGVYFECEDTVVEIPESEGYVGVAWRDFYDVEAEEDIYDYIDSLDYISIYVQEAIGIYYIADLHAFKWSSTSADFEALNKAITDAKNYMETLNIDEWGAISWDNVFIAIDEAEALIGQYGVTDEDVSKAIDNITSKISKLVPINESIKKSTLQKLENAYKSAKTYWRGNVTAASYRPLSLLLKEAEEIFEIGSTDEVGLQMIDDINNAVANLVPIKEGGRVTTIYSLESFTGRDFNSANGHRSEGVNYSLDKSYPKYPEGYAQGLCMEATVDKGSETTDQHGSMQFKTMKASGGPMKIGEHDENILIGDLTGTDGIRFWVGVNDLKLASEATLRFGVSNCTKGPLFEMHAVDIPIPATGSGWITVPWEYFEYYDDWTNGQPINLSMIYFYIFRVEGIIKQGFKVYLTGIYAYKDSTGGEWNEPTVNITEGQEIDTSEQDFIPDWSEGSAILDGKFLVYGDHVPTNGDHTLVITNGNKTKTVNFKTIGAVIDPTPVITGVEDEGIYEGSATPSWDVGTGTLNGEPFENGTEIKEAGTYTLIVTNGNAVPVEITFRVIEKQGPSVKKGDFDNDGEITVTDALAALRIAAKLAPETDLDIAIGDTDNDGHVTVTDALAILRVAAKLATEL